ncbi:MAG: SIS domain-containing protein [Pseudomonadota bacterium]|nr:SIS domain-containing protein [Pseudomonadota bacterium]
MPHPRASGVAAPAALAPVAAARAALIESAAVHARIVAGDLDALVARAALEMCAALRRGGTIYWCGNGGSAADAQHLAAELVGRFYQDRPPLRSQALTVNSSVLTALVNDYRPERVFERQVQAFVTDRDVFVGLSTSGESANVVLALTLARTLGAWTLALTGEAGGALADQADLALRAPSRDVPRIQEAHILLGHTICELIEREMAP